MRQNGLLRRRALLKLAAGSAAPVYLGGCGPVARGPAVPLAQTGQASVLGLSNERFFPFSGTTPLEKEMIEALDRKRRVLGVKNYVDLPELQLLAVSGGGENGAFGAGLLCGWTVQGTRPTFDWVTGVSTGALTAPFAFLGSAYDPQLRSVYTGLSPLKRSTQNPRLSTNAPADYPVFTLERGHASETS